MSVSFDFKRRLGAGFFGEVWHAIDNGLGCEIALKCIPPDKIIYKDNFYQEAQTLKASEHSNIVKVNETGDLDDGRIYVSMEYLPNGSLEDEAQGAPIYLSRAKRIMIDVLRGLDYAHSKKIVHRDIKPANILIGNAQEGILSDFGLALPDISTLDISYLKQYQYMLHLAPEVNKPEEYTYLSDIYACGSTLYRMINGDTYLPPISPRDVRDLIMAGKFPPRNKHRDYVPTSLRRLINKAININPNKRYTSAEEMRNALEQQEFYVNWTERRLRTGQVWRGTGKNGMNYMVKKTIDPNRRGRWLVVTKKGWDNKQLRKVTEYCRENMDKHEASKTAKKILQDLVNGKA
jgi:serine/threonine protein kinase